MPKFRLKQLEIVNFRGFRGAFTIPFNRPIVAIYGPVGAGKSSIAQAIEYALFGHQLEIKERIAKLADLVNEEETEARVCLTLESEEGELKILRVLKKSGDTARETHVELYYGGRKIAATAKDATAKIVEILRLDEEDFTRFVLVTHRVLESLIYGTSTRRSLTIDRLFGIDILEGLYKAIPIKKIEEILEQEKSKLSAYKELPELIARFGSLEEARRALERYKAELEELRRLEEELTRRYNELLSERANILQTFRGLESVYLKYLQVKSEREALEAEIAGKESEVSETSIKVDLDLLRSFLISRLEELMLAQEAEELSRLQITGENLEDVALKIYEVVKKLESTLDRLYEEQENLTKLVQDLQKEASSLESQRSMLERRLRELEPTYREYQGLVSKYGTYDDLKREVAQLRQRLEDIERESALAISVIRIAEHILARRLETCPVCGAKLSEDKLREIEEAVTKLREKHSRAVQEIEELRRKIAELEQVLTRLESLRQLAQEYEELSTRVKMIREQHGQVVAKLETAQKNLRLIDKRIQLLKIVIDEVRARIDKVDQKLTLLKKLRRYRELVKQERELEAELRKRGLDLERAARIESEISEIERKLEQVRQRLNTLSVEVAKLERVLSSIPIETVEELRNRVVKLEDLCKKLNDIRNALKKVQVSLREKMIEKTQAYVDNYFKVMYPYPDLAGAGIEITIKEKLGTITSEYVLYGIRRGGRKVPISRMSDGQRLTVALAFMLAVYVIANHNVSFIIMDEPMPYVDVGVRQAFASLITKLITENLVSQLVVTSQSREFIDLIISEARKHNIPVELVEIERRETERRINIMYIE